MCLRQIGTKSDVSSGFTGEYAASAAAWIVSSVSFFPDNRLR